MFYRCPQRWRDVGVTNDLADVLAAQEAVAAQLLLEPGPSLGMMWHADLLGGERSGGDSCRHT
jgi:hypothetical protein